MSITKSLNKWWISAYFFLPSTCCGIIFVYLKWPAYTWTTQQRKHPANLSLCIRLACWEQKTQHFHICVIFGFERGVKEIRAFWGGFYAASIDSFLPTFRDNSWWWWNCHSGVGEDSSHLGLFALSTGQFTCIFRANSPRWRHYVPPKRPSPFTSQQGVIFINTCVRMSCLTD